jgi:hypothetical protein
MMVFFSRSAKSGFFGYSFHALNQSHFLKAVQQIGRSLSNCRGRFLEYYTTLFCFRAADPLIMWILSIFQYRDIEDRHNLTINGEFLA